MTRVHALKRLLEHGPLTRAEIVEQTGWSQNTVTAALRNLRLQKVLRSTPVNGNALRYRVVPR